MNTLKAIKKGLAVGLPIALGLVLLGHLLSYTAQQLPSLFEAMIVFFIIALIGTLTASLVVRNAPEEPPPGQLLTIHVVVGTVFAALFYLLVHFGIDESVSFMGALIYAAGWLTGFKPGQWLGRLMLEEDLAERR